MKATGIVRRIDDLGRVVIPKEIRNTLHIRESDPLEIYTGDSGEVIFKKYSAIGEIPTFANKFAELLHKEISAPVLITDRQNAVAVSGAPKAEFLGKPLSNEALTLLEKRSLFTRKNMSDKTVKLFEKNDVQAEIIAPIVTNGDISGSIIVLQAKNKPLNECAEKLTATTAKFISLMIEN